MRTDVIVLDLSRMRNVMSDKRDSVLAAGYVVKEPLEVNFPLLCRY